MITEHDYAMSHLHTRAVRGETLSEDERAQLSAWYLVQDELEAKQIHIPSTIPFDLLTLQKETDEALARLNAATQYVQELAAQNAILRQQIVKLERRLADHLPKAA